MSITAEQMLKMQRELQKAMPPHHAEPGALTGSTKMQYIRDMVLAATDELHEALGETGWKPWASSNHVNRNAYVGELVDAWHFFMNLLLIENISWEEFSIRYAEKHGINQQRQVDGYTGLNKCISCGRALDDEFTECTPDGCAYPPGM